MKDVARRAGLSVSCVSKYLNRPDSVLPATKEKIDEAIADLDYKPSIIARSLRTKRSRIIVVLMESVINPFFAALFEAIRRELSLCLGELALSIEHVGSTSVEGLSAKPCIDLDVVIADASRLPAVISGLEAIGYIHEGDLGIKGREAFKYTNKPHLQNHHLYVCPRDSEELHRHLTFRDYLKNHPEAVTAYSRVKETAARLYPDSIDGYMAYKSPCIEELYALCGLK